MAPPELRATAPVARTGAVQETITVTNEEVSSSLSLPTDGNQSPVRVSAGIAKIIPLRDTRAQRRRAAAAQRREQRIRQQAVDALRALSAALETADPQDLEDAILEASRLLAAPVIDLCRNGALA